ncbi:MAG: efflux RND transporter periplasmic adaptor subunit [Lachnospiraceae bacterium]|nr:efflux RND transporter periplasmic adaptor subunit [Lachnospiraceae bacterium]
MKFIKKHKILLIILILIIIGAVVFVAMKKKKESEMAADTGPSLETETVTRQTISNYVSITGTIAANDSQTVYAGINEVEVKDVLVEVGDEVTEGQVLAILDSSEFEDKLASARNDLSIQQQKTALSLAKAQTSYADTVEDAAYAMRDAQEAVDEAVIEYKNNETDKHYTWEDWQDAIEDYNDAEKEYNEAKKKLKKLRKNKDSVTYDGKTYFYDSDGETDSDGNEVSTLGLHDLKKVVEDLEDKMDSAQKSAEKAKHSYESAEQGLDKDLRSYSGKLEDKDDKQREEARKIRDAQAEVYSTQLDAQNSTSQLEDQIKNYEKNIEKCSIKAPISGVVTAVKIEKGDETGSEKNVICVINDTSSYKVEGSVDEYDISKLSEGLSAVIRTEATGDTEMTGKVTYVAKTPETASSSSDGESSSKSSGYPIEVLIDKIDDDVRIGMTAKTNILTKTAEDVLTVPYDCITQNLDGDYVVYAVDESKVTVAGEDQGKPGFSEASGDSEGGSGMPGGPGGRPGGPGGPPGFGGSSDDEENDISMVRAMGKEIVVEKILEADYYTAISGEGLREGMEVYKVSSSDEDDEDDDSVSIGFY